MKLTILLSSALAVLSAVPSALSVEEQNNYSFNDQVQGLVAEDDIDICDPQVDAVVTCFGGDEAIEKLDNETFDILVDVYDYYYFDDYDEATDEDVLSCEYATPGNCAIIMAEINSLEKCVSETTALFKCRDSTPITDATSAKTSSSLNKIVKGDSYLTVSARTFDLAWKLETTP
eukprot:CAMPEP_0113371768 /NCGR_PEP_ID=MMETSP0013_2-20120614/184_1 /TAXON_ID=2843 ORGANISM="Skeletonema costatum, Strain 1716" /NCGR_SAMPLE_ID=MMETSP0013_2 /ASSEMBLY_ACC=CAM_ASM_000158 /LENGTH=174 /DNA_ID=CAMNT_0000253629 /DNA_START=46 /DNA_END=571 /DNA_ORIENTATION=+ /assembly_acc=CAM_ASM_000158